MTAEEVTSGIRPEVRGRGIEGVLARSQFSLFFEKHLDFFVWEEF